MSGPPEHGGDLADAVRHFGVPRERWLDLSTGINPHPYPVDCVPGAAWGALPQADRLRDLCRAAAAYYRVPDPACVLALPGTQAAIQLLPQMSSEFLGAGPVTVLGPTYNEHAGVWRRAGYDVREADGANTGQPLPAGGGCLVVVNPNNPDGRSVDPLRLREWQRTSKGVLIADEAFADVRPELSLAPEMPLERVILLRSFGKFFGLAGLRLGFVVAPPALLARLAELAGPWAVSGPAIEIGCRAFADAAWIAETRVRLSAGMARLRDLLSGAGFSIVGGTDLFVLVAREDSEQVYESLGRAGILVRRFAVRPGLLRFGQPGPEAAWRRLADALDGGEPKRRVRHG